jgi:hypothetical protein
MIAIITALAAGLLGFLAGLLTFKVKTSWCRTCGTTLSCSACTNAVLPPGGYRRLA